MFVARYSFSLRVKLGGASMQARALPGALNTANYVIGHKGSSQGCEEQHKTFRRC